MTETLQEHSESLQHATSTATDLQSILESTITTANSMTTSFGQSSRLIDWILRISSPFISVFLGNYKVTPSLHQNALLIVSGESLFGFKEAST